MGCSIDGLWYPEDAIGSWPTASELGAILDVIKQKRRLVQMSDQVFYLRCFRFRCVEP